MKCIIFGIILLSLSVLNTNVQHLTIFSVKQASTKFGIYNNYNNFKCIFLKQSKNKNAEYLKVMLKDIKCITKKIRGERTIPNKFKHYSP